MKEKLVSVIVPVYNVERELDECVSSLVDQSYRNLEILLVDDGSTDSSGRMCDQWRDRDNRVRTIHKENAGVSSARNVGVSAATGAYICFVDGDDWLDREAIKSSVLAAEEKNADVVMFSNTQELASSSVKRALYPESRVFVGEEIQRNVVRKLYGPVGENLLHPEQINWIAPVWGKLYRSDFLKHNQTPFISLDQIGTFEDGLYNLDLIRYANVIVYINSCWYHYRKNRSEQCTRLYKPDLFEQYCSLYRMMQERAESYGTEQDALALRNRICIEMITHALNVSASEMSFSEKRKALSDILNSDLYRTAFRKFSTAGMRPHWKVFYLCCKYRLMTGVTLLSGAMFQIRERRNNG